MKAVRVLQLGANNFEQTMPVSECAEWYYEPDFSELPKKDFDVVILDREITEDEFDFLVRFAKAYTLFITETVFPQMDGLTQRLIVRKKGKTLSWEALETLLREELPYYFSGHYGEKMKPWNVSVAQGFHGSVFWRGFEGVHLSGDFGEELTQALYWRLNLPVESGQVIEFWLEYVKDTSIEIELEITMLWFRYGTDTASEKVWTFKEEELEDLVYIENKSDQTVRIFMSLKAKGSGNLTVIALHDRYSRRGKGIFIPGGKRRVTSNREEVFYYFEPGNLKPPLNVYFSGYKTQEGFEGYNLMRRLGHPFLLIAEARLEGGALYMGSEEYENMIEQVIRDCMGELGFQSSDVILSGISGGAYGALYYGCKIQPHTILIGKAVANIGDIAANERINRPGVFPSSLDILHFFSRSLSRGAVYHLNSRFWNLFDQTDWSGTQFAVAYMIEDDYDNKAYGQLQTHLKGTGVKLYGKGLHGRHNDDSKGIVSWFVNQYKRILRDDFGDRSGETGGER